MLYFAYGSNLNLHQMQQRCPMVCPIDRHTLPGWRLVFRGVADIIPAEGHSVPGAIYSITKPHETALDRYEGFPRLYIKQTIRDPRLGPIMLYRMNPAHTRSQAFDLPSPFYFDTILEGYADWRISPRHLHQALSFTQANLEENLVYEPL